MKILLLGKSDLVRQRLAMMLAGAAAACSVETVANVEEALQTVLLPQPAIVVMNSLLPDAKAIRCIALLKEKYPATCVIVAGSERVEAYRRRWLEAGADYFFDLTTQFDDLISVIRQAVSVMESKTAA